jgi:hypothetical protein
MPKDEMFFIGGPLDGLSLNANDATMDWPIAVVFEMCVDEGKTPFGADEIPSGIVKTRATRYEIIDSGEAENGDAFGQYIFRDVEDFEHDTNRYADDGTDPFSPTTG